MAGLVSVKEIEDTPVLELAQEIDGETYVTWIYYYDGSIRELFTSPDSGLGVADGIAVLECEGLSMHVDDGLLTVETAGSGGGQITLALRSEGGVQ